MAGHVAPPVVEEEIEGAAVLYLEGYLYDPETPRYAMLKAIDIARRAGRKVAFSLSDTFCIERHRDGFNALIDGGKIDILFANQAEIEMLAGVAHLDSAIDLSGGAKAGNATAAAGIRWSARSPCRWARASLASSR